MSVIKKEHIPNYLSVFRMALIPVFIYTFFLEEDGFLLTPLVVFLGAGLTDMVDGYLARKYSWITNVGKVLDPLADKLMQATVLICLSIGKRIPFYLAVTLIIKELAVICGAAVIIKKNKVYVQSNWYGKMAVVLFYAGMVFLMVKKWDYTVQNIMSVIMIATMIFALVMYYIEVYKGEYEMKLKKSKKEKTEKITN